MPTVEDRGPYSEPASAWDRLLDHVHSDIPVLRDQFLERVRTVPAYDGPLVPLERVAEDAEKSFAYLLARMASSATPPGPGEHIGRDRARRGVPLTDLMAAIHLDAGLVWEAIRHRAGSEEMPLLVEKVGDVLQAVETYADEVHRAYVAEEELIRRAAVDEVDAVFSRFMAGDGNPGAASAVERVLGLQGGRPVVILATTSAERCDLRLQQRRFEAAGRRSSHFLHHDCAVLIVKVAQPLMSSELPLLAPDLDCAWAVARHGVEDLRDGVELACALARVTVGTTGSVTLRSHWADLLMAHSGRVGQALHEEFGGLRDAGSDATAGQVRELRLVEETLQEYLRTGSVNETAAALFVHRNTVVNRLRRVTEVTGLDPRVPRDAAALLVGSSLGPSGAPTMP